MPSDLLIRNAVVVTLDSGYSVLQAHDLAVKDGLIAAIGPTGSLGDARYVVDASGQFLLPGLINAHTHVGMSYFKATAAAMELFKWLEWGWFYIERMDDEDIYWAAMLACMEMLRAGVTTFSDMYFSEKVIAKAVAQTGIRACLSESIMEPAGGMEMKTATAAQLEYARSLYEEWHGAAQGRINVMIAPHSPYACSADVLVKVASLADELGARLHIHLSETEAEVREAHETWHMSPPAYLNSLGLLDRPITAAHCVHLSDTDIELLDRPTFGISHNPAANLKLQSGIAPVTKMVDRRLAVGLGSDGNGSNDVIDILKDVYLASILHTWKEEQQPTRTCLAMATREGARALGLEQQIGTLQVGKKADMVLISPDNARATPVHEAHDTLALTCHGDDVTTTIVNGEIVMRNGQFLAFDAVEVLAQARERSARIFGVQSPVTRA
ncbi:MAG: amidohydrolase [Anaerolineae bacterium]|nr:amidohydrolase [Anaerolineae bacterium]